MLKSTLISEHFGIFVATFGCQTTNPGSPEAVAKAAEEAEEIKVEAAEAVVSDIPDWCLNLPISENALYACGSGDSSNLNMSRTRATLDAKRQLADMIDSEISSRMEDFLSSIGTGANEQIQQQSEIVTKNVTVEAKLTVTTGTSRGAKHWQQIPSLCAS